MNGNGVINFATQSTAAQGINVTEYTFASSAASGTTTAFMCVRQTTPALQMFVDMADSFNSSATAAGPVSFSQIGILSVS
jgi:hypothetical protein